MEFLKLILGEELYNQFKEKVETFNNDPQNKEKQVNLANLGTGDYVSKRKYNDLETKFNSKNNELEQANNLIEEFKKSTPDNDALKNKIGEYEGKIVELQNQLRLTNTENALKIALLNAKVTDADYLTYKLKEQGELELGEDGSIKGLEEKLGDLKIKYPNFFEDTKNTYVDPNPLPNSKEPNTLTKTDILKKSYAERNALYEQNPEAYNKIMKS